VIRQLRRLGGRSVHHTSTTREHELRILVYTSRTQPTYSTRCGGMECVGVQSPQHASNGLHWLPTTGEWMEVITQLGNNLPELTP